MRTSSGSFTRPLCREEGTIRHLRQMWQDGWIMGLSRISVAGYKTIENLDSFEPRSLSVLIGPNGAGKSNLISFFRLLSNLLSGNLRVYVGLAGGAAKLLHDGPQRTQVISASITIESEAGVNEYSFGLGYASQDTFVFLHEQYRYTPHAARPAQWTDLDAGHRESRLRDFIEERRTARTIHGMLQKLIVHQFHNTSRTARMKETWSVADGRWLKEDAANLAPFLYRLQTSHPPYYRRIVQTLRGSLPFFDDFVLEPEHGGVLLQWREAGSDVLFDASQASDGMLRFLALVALLRQPEADLPAVLILDEPELGLHPHAVQVLVDLIQSISSRTQVIIATQSVSLVDRFDPSDIVVVQRAGRASTFSRLNEADYKEWLDEYTLSELWEKNVIGGRPH